MPSLAARGDHVRSVYPASVPILHILTKKGKGYEPAIAKPDKFHGLGKFSAETGETAAASTPTYSEILGKTLGKFADTNRKIVALPGRCQVARPRLFPGAASGSLLRRWDCRGTRFAFACGLATQGLKPFLTIYSTFMQRAYDMIIHDIALQNLNVALCMDRAGLSGDDGPTHHGLFDIGYLRHVPNIVHMQPKDEDEFIDMLWTMANYNSGRSPSVIRAARELARNRRQPPNCSKSAKPKWCNTVQDVAIFRSRNMFEMAEDAAVSWRHWAFPSRSSIPAGSNRSTRARWNFSRAAVQVLCTIEDHVLHNGFGCG